MSRLVITGMEMPQICFMCRFCKKLWTEEGNFLSAECILTNDTLDQDDVNWFPYSCPLCEVPDWIQVWIPVSKRLPDHNCSTLICTENGKVCQTRFYPEKKGWNGFAGKKAKYWMYLPDPPKKGYDDVTGQT